ncbi:MAG: type VI secretion system baseplate subunit TssK [Gemmatimonadaceae bacterium]
MRQLSRVVWHEGMHLAQHHFQAQSRYAEDAFHFALSQLFPFPYGLSAVTLDADALRNGTVSLLQARGILPDGLAFQIPDADPAPPPRELGEVFSPTQDSHVVHLAIPAFRPSGANCAIPGNVGGNGGGNGTGDQATPRFRLEPRRIVDETAGRDEQSVGLGRRNFSLLLDVELTADDVSLPIARVRRDGAGHLVYDAAFIPPLLQIGASERLLWLLRRLVEVLDIKGETIGGRRRADALGEFAAQEVASFWLLHTIHASLPALRHQLETRHGSPEALFVELSRLAGSLCTFALHSHPRSLPVYDHDRLEETFGALERHIREHLEVVIPESCLSVPLARESAVLHAAPLPDQRVFGRSHWILGVRAAVTTGELAQRMPQYAKVCAHRFVLKLVERALPGLAMEHIAAPPPAISPRSDTVYFALTKAGPCWDTIVQTREIGVYVPDAVPGAEMELLVVLEGG